MQFPIERLVLSVALMAVSAASLPGQGGYSGPSVLTRPDSSRLGGRSPFAFRPYVTVLGTYDTGLTGVSLGPDGRVVENAAYGTSVGFGASSGHSWKKTSLLFDYRGGFQHYYGRSFYDSSNHSLTLAVSHQASRRWQVYFGENAGMYSRAFNYGNPTVNDPSLSIAPANALFDNPTYYFSTQAGVVFQKSSRLSFSAGGGVMAQRYRSHALISGDTYGVMGDIAYRYSRDTTIGLAYGFGHFHFKRGFGASDYHQAVLFWSRRLTRGWEVSLGGGAVRAESLFLASVAVDPVIAAITGQSTGVIAAYGVNYGSIVRATARYAFRNAGLNFYYQRGLTPGNGVYLTSWQETAGTAYSYSGIRHWSLSADAGYSRMKTTLQTYKPFTSYYGTAGVSRDIIRNAVHFVARVGYHRYNTGVSSFRRDGVNVSVGLAYSPGEVPLKFW